MSVRLSVEEERRSFRTRLRFVSRFISTVYRTLVTKRAAMYKVYNQVCDLVNLRVYVCVRPRKFTKRIGILKHIDEISEQIFFLIHFRSFCVLYEEN